MATTLDTFTLLAHPRPRLTIASNPSIPDLQEADLLPPILSDPTHPSTNNDQRMPRPVSQSHIPLRPLSQLSQRARRHSQSRLSHRKASASHDAPPRPVSQLPKSTGQTRRPSSRLTRREDDELVEPVPSRPQSALSITHLGRARPVSHTLEPVPGTPAKPPLQLSTYRPSCSEELTPSPSPLPTGKPTEHGLLTSSSAQAPHGSDGTFGSADQARKARMLEHQQRIAQVQAAAAALVRRDRERERERAAAALEGRVPGVELSKSLPQLGRGGKRKEPERDERGRVVEVKSRYTPEGKGKGKEEGREREREKGKGLLGKSEAERIKDAYRAQAQAHAQAQGLAKSVSHAQSQSQSQSQGEARTLSPPAIPAPTPAHPLPTETAAAGARPSPAPAKPNPPTQKQEEHPDGTPTTSFPLPLKPPQKSKRWDPASGLPLLRSALLGTVPGAGRWTAEDWEAQVQLGEELGYGNWGSVRTLQLPQSQPLTSLENKGKGKKQVYAAKLVLFASEPKTAEIRLWALWKEYQILRGCLPAARDVGCPVTYTSPLGGSSTSSPQLPVPQQAPEAAKGEEEGGERHPGVLNPLAFLEFPGGGLMLMPLLKRQMPVCVREGKARKWFLEVLGAVGWLHGRGVVHNDIKPANIMLTETDQPVLIDFGFAQHHPPSKGAERFQSQLAYGTPEYLSPERARGQKHDTRLSDVYSLGVTFFEVLVGRTPFESTPAPSASPLPPTTSTSAADAAKAKEQPKADPDMSTEEGLKVYWERTRKGEWVGSWTFSKGLERLLRGMMNPEAGERPFADACATDVYFAMEIPGEKATVKRQPEIAIAPAVVVSAETTEESTPDALPTRERKASLRSVRVSAKGTAPPTPSPSKLKPSRIPVFRDRVESQVQPLEIGQDRANPTPASPPRRKHAPMSPNRGRAGKENRASLLAGHTPARKPLAEHKVLVPRGDFELKKEKERVVENIALAKRERRRTVSPLPPIPLLGKRKDVAEAPLRAPVTKPVKLFPSFESEQATPLDEVKMRISSNEHGRPSVSAKEALVRMSAKTSSGRTALPPAAVGRKASERISTALARSQSGSVMPSHQESAEDLKTDNRPESRQERMSQWLKSLDKVVEDTKATFAEPVGKSRIPRIPVPIRSTSARKTTRPGLRELFDLPPPAEPEVATPVVENQMASSVVRTGTPLSPVLGGLSPVLPVPERYSVSALVSGRLSPRSPTPTPPPETLPASTDDGHAYEDALLKSSTVVKHGDGYQSGVGTARRVGRGFQSMSMDQLAGQNLASSATPSRSRRSKISKHKRPKSHVDEERSVSVMSFFTLPRKVTSPTPPVSPPPVSVPPLSPEPMFSPPTSPVPPKHQRSNTVLKIGRAIKAVFHRRQPTDASGPSDIEGPNMLGFVQVTQPVHV